MQREALSRLVRATFTASVAGLLAAGAPAPVWTPLLALAGFALLAALLIGTRARLLRVAVVFVFAAAMIASGCAWIHDGIRGDGHNAPWLALLLFAGFVALYASVHAALYAAFDRCVVVPARTRGALWRGAFALAAAWICAEWLRSVGEWALPWLFVGTQQVDNPFFAGLLPLGGVHLAGFVAAYTAALAGGAIATRTVDGRAAAALGVMLVLSGLASGIAWTEPTGAPIDVALLQSNYPQEDKWDDRARARAKADLLAAVGATAHGVIVTPETYVLDAVQQAHGDYWSQLAERARAGGKHVLVGGIYADTADAGRTTRFYNAIVHVAPGRADVYAKRRLVPFGEYMPWTSMPGAGWVYQDVFHYPLRGLSRADDALAGNLFVAGHEVTPSICYEIAFAGDIARRARNAAWLLNVSNDAWFPSGQYRFQAEQIARTRALENRRWVVRANNVGRTALIAPDGSVLRAEEGRTLVLRGRVEPRAGNTPYQVVGDVVVAALVLAALVLGAATALRARGRLPRAELGWESR